MKADVIVIGAGALGLSTALHCALLGRSVVVVERDQAGSQASGRAAGLFKSVQADELRTSLARRSIERASCFAEWTGTPLEVVPSGSFLVARTPEQQANLRAEARQSAGWGVEVTEAGPGQLADRVSLYRGDGSELALWCPDGRFVTGPVPDAPGLWVASGCNGSGFSSSLAIGEALAAWICDQPERLDISALSPARFGPLTDEALVTAGVWQYAHYYDPAGQAPAQAPAPPN